MQRAQHAAFCAWWRAVKLKLTTAERGASAGVTRASGSPTRTTSMSSRSTGKSAGMMAVPPGGSAATSSPFARRTPSSESDELEVDGADIRDHADLRPGDLAERRDLPEAAHRQLQDAHLRLGLEAAERQRHPDLVVVARLRSHGSCRGHAERSQDVLRRRLPHRAGDADDTRVAAISHLAADPAERVESVVGHERRRGATARTHRP